MKTVTILFALVQLASLSSFASVEIIGGTKVKTTDLIAKSVVALIATKAHSQALCTASIVAKDLAITAAHCISNDASLPNAKAARTTYTLVFHLDIHNALATDLRAVDRIVVPKSWNPHSLSDGDTSDVALLHFSDGLPKGYVVSDLLPFDANFQVGNPVTLAGYGISNASADTGAGVLRKAEVKVKNPNYSKSEIEFDQSQGGGACHGDSGGPAYVIIEGHPYLFGITSRGGGNCDESVIYTKVEAYQDWFKEAVEAIRK